jgi:RNA polymerase sigma factor (sigma-70 family)
VTDDEHELLRGVADGDPDFEGIYRAYGRVMQATAQQVLGAKGRVVDSKDIEDVVHDAFTDIMKKGLLTPDTLSIAARLRRVTFNKAYDAVRRATHVQGRPIEELPEADRAVAPLDAWHEAQADRELGQAVWRNLRRLDARERRIYAAHINEGRSFAQIGTELGLSGQRIGQLFRRAMQKLLAEVDLTGGDQ